MVKTSKSNVGKSSFKKFMKSSQISPHFINNELDRDLDVDLDYKPNYGKSLESLESHASHAVNITPNVNENIESGSESGSGSDESYHSNNTLDSDYDSDNDEIQAVDDDDNDNNENSYSSITKTKDLKIFKMKNLLARKRSTLLNKEQEIKELGKQNSFLETVIRDYENYNTAILEEKQKQKKALKILSQHIRDIYKNNNNKDESHLSRVKNDQTLLLDEIEKIRDEIAHVLNSRGVEYQSSDGDSDVDDNNDNDDNDDNDGNDDYRGMY